jgi:hypothetical protein
MAADEEILNAIRLVSEYYGAEPNETQVRLWLRLLEPYPGEVIERAVISHIEHSKWAPKVSEIRDLCDQRMPSNSYQVDPLAAELLDLEQDFYFNDRRLDVAAWEHLADKFERIGRHERAANTRQRLANLKNILEQESQP